MTDQKQTQIDKFKQAAREHGADESEAHWDERLKRVAKVKPSKKAGIVLSAIRLPIGPVIIKDTIVVSGNLAWDDIVRAAPALDHKSLGGGKLLKERAG